jgi:hypothetical protein
MENSPPGIQTIPSGTGPGTGVLFSAVSTNVSAVSIPSDIIIAGVELIARFATAAPMVVTTTAAHAQFTARRREKPIPTWTFGCLDLRSVMHVSLRLVQ